MLYEMELIYLGFFVKIFSLLLIHMPYEIELIYLGLFDNNFNLLLAIIYEV